jgi:predicted TIM-barrel fold metal-dependent hydrolase
MIVDVHLHTGTVGEQIAPAMFKHLRTVFRVRAFKPAELEADVDAPQREEGSLIALMDANGVDLGCVMAGDWRRAYGCYRDPDSGDPMDYYVSNDYVAALVRRYPGRLVGTMNVDPLRDPAAACREMVRCVEELGMKGMKLYPTYQHFDPSDERVFPVYKQAIELDLPVQFHMGWTPVPNAPMRYQRPELLDDVGHRFPELKVVICHMAYPWYETANVLISKYRNFYGELSGWGLFYPEKLLRLLHDYGSLCPFEKLLYGSENPLMASSLAMFRELDAAADRCGLPRIDPAAVRLILGENALRLYQIDAAAMARAASAGQPASTAAVER